MIIIQPQNANTTQVYTMRFRRILLKSDPSPLLFFAALCKITWGIWIGIDSAFDTVGAYSFLAQYGEEWQWGLAVCLLGTVEMISILKLSHKWQRWTSLLGAASWAGLSGGIAVVAFVGFTWLMFAMFAVADLWGYILLGEEAFDK